MERTGGRGTARGVDGSVNATSSWSTSWGGAVLRVVILAVALLLLVGFAAVLAELTLTPSPASSKIAGSNLQPGHSLRQYAEDYTFLAACKQVGGNVLMGAPFGLLLPVLVPRRFRMLRVMALTVVMMTVVELAQGAIVEGRAFDVDDVIMNTSGAFLAYLLIGRRFSHRFHTLGFRSLEAQARREREREEEREAERRERVAEKKARRAGVGTPTTGRTPWTERVRSAVRREPVAAKKSAAPARKTAGKKAAAKKTTAGKTATAKKSPVKKTTPAKKSPK
ncbi:VanZ family protein [Streptomyces sp. IB2014 016-6]|uniref:VanZ family protein n=1 Tax=Streptomyces sp. IB2014 016-6 TaxID=2517818 RepID=UPI0011C9CFDF|nr:VanZ family protein [Streptomyces sp. IB2014 016-6]TXL87279.1 VanZ family protein [Streptomyces sp. IB2014 016-6]